MNNLLEYLRGKTCQGFRPLPRLNHDANFIEWYWRDDPAYEEPVHDNGVWAGSLLRALDSDDVVGVKIHLESVRR